MRTAGSRAAGWSAVDRLRPTAARECVPDAMWSFGMASIVSSWQGVGFGPRLGPGSLPGEMQRPCRHGARTPRRPPPSRERPPHRAVRLFAASLAPGAHDQAQVAVRPAARDLVDDAERVAVGHDPGLGGAAREPAGPPPAGA